jgi:hypothetical protein
MNANGTADADTRRRARKAGPNPAILAVDIAKRLRNALDWQKEIDAVLSEMGMALRGHRMILFKLMEMPGDPRPFTVDPRFLGRQAPGRHSSGTGHHPAVARQ